ncbi:hypothetical protein FHW83_003940 [Duganella sp. SG902]|nr:hypothetical protein [Duganella sp. SG902]NVM78116.1 hypothetical protein [Duganella sp. SG902]
MKITKFALAAGLLLSSAMALAANAGCCGDAICCIKMLLCC